MCDELGKHEHNCCRPAEENTMLFGLHMAAMNEKWPHDGNPLPASIAVIAKIRFLSNVI